MGLCSKMFYEDSQNETLSSRLTLSPEQLEDAQNKKDNLLSYIKPELSRVFDTPVKHWLQGSYKNHTLIRPVRKGEEFDIDVGLYILCNAEDEGLSALESKELNRAILNQFVQFNKEAKLEDCKTNCERISYLSSFHIDIPLYFYDADTNTCKLANQNDGWVDSDPKSFQNWFDGAVSKYDKTELSQLRRCIRYLKAWTALKAVVDGIYIPSIAITVLVVNHFTPIDGDDDALIDLVVEISSYIDEHDFLISPVGSSDLFGFNIDEYSNIRLKLEAFRKTCEHVSKSDDSFMQYVLWNTIFEHMFPSFVDHISYVSDKTNLPAITIQPKIRVRHMDKLKMVQSNTTAAMVSAYKADKLYFSIDNANEYSPSSAVYWTVRNQGEEAKRINDLGHKANQTINEERYENCSYSGTHYMDCIIVDKGKILGVGSTIVNVKSFSRPMRNPPRKRYF